MWTVLESIILWMALFSWVPIFMYLTKMTLSWGSNSQPKYLPLLFIQKICCFVGIQIRWFFFAIFQLYSDGTVVQFPNLDLLPSTQCHGQLGFFSMRACSDNGTRTSEDVFNLLAITGPTGSEGMPGIGHGLYLNATAAGVEIRGLDLSQNQRKLVPHKN